MADVPAKITVLIADSLPLVCYGLWQTLAAEPDFQVVAEAHDGREALAGLRVYQPHLAVLDIDIPPLDVFHIAAAVRAGRLPTKIVLLSLYNHARWLKKALRLNVQGYLLKDRPLAEIVAGLRTIAQGNSYFSPAVMGHLLHPGNSASQVVGQSEDLSPELARLTSAERAILKLIAACCTTKEIAAELRLSPRTVEKHRANTCQKPGLRGNHALTKFALAQRERL